MERHEAQRAALQHDGAVLRVDVVGEPIAEATLLAIPDKLKQHLRPGRPTRYEVAGGATPGSSA
jgi:hypothetical protein